VRRRALDAEAALLSQLLNSQERDPARGAHVGRQDVAVELLQFLVRLALAFYGRLSALIIAPGRIERRGRRGEVLLAARNLLRQGIDNDKEQRNVHEQRERAREDQPTLFREHTSRVHHLRPPPRCGWPAGGVAGRGAASGVGFAAVGGVA